MGWDGTVIAIALVLIVGGTLIFLLLQKVTFLGEKVIDSVTFAIINDPKLCQKYVEAHYNLTECNGWTVKGTDKIFLVSNLHIYDFWTNCNHEAFHHYSNMTGEADHSFMAGKPFIPYWIPIEGNTFIKSFPICDRLLEAVR